MIGILILNKFIYYQFLGTGSGLAPYRGFLEEKSFYNSINKSYKMGDFHLYFGCRKEDVSIKLYFLK